MEELYMEARIAFCKCGSTRQIRGVQFNKKSNGWE